MDPNHPSNTSIVRGRGSPPNQPVFHVRPINQSNNFALVPARAQPSIDYPPYDNMICDAIRDLNQPGGSTKQTISTHIKRSNAVLPPSHEVLMTYHLKTLKNNGVLTMRRGPGRPPKARPEAPQEQQPINARPVAVLSRGQSSREQPELPVTNPTQVVSDSANGRPGRRPRRDEAVPVAPTAGVILGLPNASMQGRGRPPSLRAAGRQRKRQLIGESSGGVANAAPAGGETVAVASKMRRGPGRPPKIVRNRPRKSATPMSIREATGTLESDYGELKRKLDFACEKAKEILDGLNAGIGGNGVIAMSQVRQEVEGLLPILIVEPHGVGQVQPQAVEEVEPEAMEEMPPEEAAAQTEAETQGEEHGQEVEEGEQAQPKPQPQTEAEAMQGPDLISEE
ncbi:high mobility group A5 [Raphanus sativus]|nr:high mobility group A5 [Raphanus sativus]